MVQSGRNPFTGSSPPRFAFLFDNLGGGGVQKNTLTIAGGLRALGYDIDVVLCSRDGPLATQVPAGLRCIDLPRSSLAAGRGCAVKAGPRWWPAMALPLLFSPKPSKTLAYLPGLVGYLREQRPAAMLAATPHQNIEAVLARHIADVDTRIVVTQSNHFSSWHGMAKEWRRRHVAPLLRRAYCAAAEVIAVSAGVGRDLADNLGIPGDRLTAIHNPVLTPELVAGMSAPLTHDWLTPGKPPVVLAVGRPGRQKDFATLVRAFARVRKERPVRLLILGESCRAGGKQRHLRELNQLIDELGVASDIEFCGFVHNPYAYMARASLLVLSSHYEGFGNVVAEALACGCPVVSTDSPSGPSEILDNGRYGRLVPVGDDSAMATAIAATLTSPPDRALLRRRGRDFAIEPIARRYARLMLGYEPAVTDAGQSPRSMDSDYPQSLRVAE